MNQPTVTNIHHQCHFRHAVGSLWLLINILKLRRYLCSLGWVPVNMPGSMRASFEDVPGLLGRGAHF